LGFLCEKKFNLRHHLVEKLMDNFAAAVVALAFKKPIVNAVLFTSHFPDYFSVQISLAPPLPVN